jgi:K+-sensing histidine kinase KdpD
MPTDPTPSSERSHGDPPDSPRDGQRPAYLGYVAHEIRNPMSTALWTAELLARMTPEQRAEPRGAKLSSLCLRSVARVRLLVEDHLLCERLDAGGYPLRAEAIRLAEALAPAVTKAGLDPASVTLEQDEGLSVRADRILLERLLEGLLGAARDGSAMRVVASRQGETVEIRVHGASPAPLSDPTKGSASDQRGRALAIPMARRVAQALSGSLTVDGQAYLVRIPAA